MGNMRPFTIAFRTGEPPAAYDHGNYWMLPTRPKVELQTALNVITHK